MLQSRILVLLAFVVWCGISWNWYVCGIKQQCQGAAEPAPLLVEMEPEVPEQDITTSVSTEEPPPSRDVPVTQPAIREELSAPPPGLDRVHIEQMDDHVLIHFPYNSTRREDNADIDDYLTDLARALTGSGATVTITGHTDFVGSEADNKKIGLQRAQHIRGILTGKGIPADRIKCRSMGESKPIATNDTPQGRYRNRRVEIRIQP